MTWGGVVWVVVLVLAALLLALELASLSRPRHPWLRGVLLGAPLLTLVVAGWIQLSAWLCVQHVRSVGLSLIGDHPSDLNQYFAPRVQIGAKEYDRGPDLVAVFTTPPRGGPYVKPRREEIEAMAWSPGFSRGDLFHVYVASKDDGGPPGFSLTRFRLTGSGWKIDREQSWGCLMLESDRDFLAGIWTPVGW